jgi:ABC-2 type transport system ATP-binding protein
MEEVQSLCPRIGIIDHGQLQACDTLPTLLRELDGLIRFHVPTLTPALRARVKDLPDCRLVEPATQADWGPREGIGLELHCRDVKGTLLRLIALLNEMQVELISLEIEEPNLERVFLHLTGRALRD